MRHKEKGRLPPFVPLLIETLDSPAWQALSHGAQALYVALRRHYIPAIHNNGKVFLSQRAAAKALRSNYREIACWFRQLEHFGFIVKTEPSHLGVDGRGRATRWRLTEIGYMKEPPTRNFIRWDGTPFTNTPKTVGRQRRLSQRGRLRPLVGVLAAPTPVVTTDG
jgi:hypothetical protein